METYIIESLRHILNKKKKKYTLEVSTYSGEEMSFPLVTVVDFRGRDALRGALIPAEQVQFDCPFIANVLEHGFLHLEACGVEEGCERAARLSCYTGLSEGPLPHSKEVHGLGGEAKDEVPAERVKVQGALPLCCAAGGGGEGEESQDEPRDSGVTE